MITDSQVAVLIPRIYLEFFHLSFHYYLHTIMQRVMNDSVTANCSFLFGHCLKRALPSLIARTTFSAFSVAGLSGGQLLYIATQGPIDQPECNYTSLNVMYC